LATLGISTNDDGTLSVDQNQLTAALQSNNSGVQSFFQTVNTGFAAHIGSVLTNLVGGGGELSLDAQGYTAQNNDLTQRISDLQARLALQTQSLTATYARVNTTLQELPLLQAQLTQQIASIPSLS
jgi:flagellar hook-associated protein 2